MIETVTKQFIATKAFIEYQGKVLILQESNKYTEGTNVGKFDVVGGRLKIGEHWQESLQREAKEETGLDIEIGQPFFVNEWYPVVGGEQWQIVGIFFRCSAATDKVVLSLDHSDHKWIDPKKHGDYSTIKNLSPAFEAYVNN